MQLGFSLPQAKRLLLFFSSQKRHLSITTTQLWLQLLRRHNLEQPLDVAAKFPIILLSYNQSVESNAAVVVTWLLSLGLAQADVCQLLGRCPMLLKLPHETTALVAAWLSNELGWSSRMVNKTLTHCPKLFSSSPAHTLGPKLAWFESHGFSAETTSKMLYLHPQLFECSISRNKAQLAALQALGLPLSDVADMVRKHPSLLIRNISSDTTQAKVRFLTEVMGKQVHELKICTAYLTYSLAARIGPRWDFYSLHCPNKFFNLSTRLQHANQEFAKRLQSKTLDAECTLRGLSRLQLFEEVLAKWVERKDKFLVEGTDSKFYEAAGDLSADLVEMHLSAEDRASSNDIPNS